MKFKKLCSFIVAGMIFATGMTVYETTIQEPMIVAEATTTDTNFGLSVSMDANGNLTFGNMEDGVTNQAQVWNKVLGVLRTVIQAIGAIGTSLMILFFVLNFIKLGQNSSNASEVAKIKTAMLWNGIAAAGLGSVTLIFTLFFNLLRS